MKNYEITIYQTIGQRAFFSVEANTKEEAKTKAKWELEHGTEDFDWNTKDFDIEIIDITEEN